MDTEYLNPWYAVETDVAKKWTFCKRPISAAYVYRPQPPLQHGKSYASLFRTAELVLMELTVKTRKDVREGITFDWPGDIYYNVCTTWFDEQKMKGLVDIVFLCGEGASNAVKNFVGCCLVCWYANGSVLCFVPKEYGGKPVLELADLAQPNYKKPEFPDNAVSFKKALQAICDYVPFNGWKEIFQHGIDIMENGGLGYKGLKDTIDIPAPYFKYFYAAQVTQLGAGMGSWYDLPIAGTKDFKRITDSFTNERSKAQMYAINNC